MSNAAELTKAAGKGDARSVKRLLQGGAPVNAKVRTRGIPTAVRVRRRGDTSPPPVDTPPPPPPVLQGAHGNTPLHLAAAGGFTSVIKALLEGKANVSRCSLSGAVTRLTHSALLRFAAALPLLSTTLLPHPTPSQVNMHAADGSTPLHRAAAAGHGEACAALLAGGASPDVLTPRRVSPLVLAAEAGHGAACAALMAGGADPELKNPAGASPVQLAIQNGHAAAVAAMIENGLDPNSRTPEGLTLLESAAHHGRADVLTALIHGGADVDATNAKGETALHKLALSFKDSRMLPNGGASCC